MPFNRVAVAAALAAGGMSWPSPAAADADAFGTYSFTAEDGENATWVLTPCADSAPGCVRVAETGNAKRAPWSGDAHWSVGSLILVVEQPDAILCQDGGSVPGMNTYSWDGTSLVGSASILSKGACGAKSASLSIPFKLSRLGAAEAPVPAGPPAAVQGPPAPPGRAPPATSPPPQVTPAPPPQVTPAIPAPPLAAESSAGPPGALPAPAG